MEVIQHLNGCKPGTQPVKSTGGPLAEHTDLAMFLKNCKKLRLKKKMMMIMTMPESTFSFFSNTYLIYRKRIHMFGV